MTFTDHLQIDVTVAHRYYSHHASVFVNVNDVQFYVLALYFALQRLPRFHAIGFTPVY